MLKCCRNLCLLNRVSSIKTHKVHQHSEWMASTWTHRQAVVWWALFARSCRYLNKAVFAAYAGTAYPHRYATQEHPGGSFHYHGLHSITHGWFCSLHWFAGVSIFHIARQLIKIRCREIKRRLAKAVGAQRINFHSARE